MSVFSNAVADWEGSGLWLLNSLPLGIAFLAGRYTLASIVVQH